MANSINLYIAGSSTRAQKASRYACERSLENGLPVLLLGSSSFHSGISSPADSVILSSKISRGYSFNLLSQSTISQISSPLEKLSSQALAVLLGLTELEAYQLELALNIAKFQQRRITTTNHLQAILAWINQNFFELPSWFGRINLNTISILQEKILEIKKLEDHFSNGNFSISQLPAKDYLGYGVCNLIDTDKLDETKTNFIIANLLNGKSTLKPALVIENAQDIKGYSNGALLELLTKQNVFSSISITAVGTTNIPANINVIDAEGAELTCRSNLKNSPRKVPSLRNQITKEKIQIDAIPRISALEMLWKKTIDLTRKELD